MNRQDRIIPGIGRIYLNGLKRFAAFLAFVAASAGIGAAIIFPIWYSARHATRAFTIAALLLICGGIVYLIVRRIISGSGSGTDRKTGGAFVRFLWNLGAVIAILGEIYFAVLFLLRGMTVPFIIMVVIVLFSAGAYLYVRKKRRA